MLRCSFFVRRMRIKSNASRAICTTTPVSEKPPATNANKNQSNSSHHFILAGLNDRLIAKPMPRKNKMMETG